MMSLSVTDDQDGEKTALHVMGSCEMCKERIEKAALSVAGVKKATWEAAKKELSIVFDGSRNTLTAVHRAVAASGHDTDMFKADDAVYKALPACCLYRD